MDDIDKLKEDLMNKINSLSLPQLSKLCLNIVNKIVNKDSDKSVIKNNPEVSKEILVDLMIRHNIKIDNGDNNE